MAVPVQAQGQVADAPIGKLSVLSLAEARKRAEKARVDAADGKHLTTAKYVAKAKVAREEGNTFRAMADSWMRRRRDPPWSVTHREQVQASIDNHVDALYPFPVTEITAALVAPILTRIERRAATGQQQPYREVAESGRSMALHPQREGMMCAFERWLMALGKELQLHQR
jgi:hypothetical protein